VPSKPMLLERITALRKQRAEETGLTLPAISFEDAARLPGFDYEIVLFGTAYARGKILPEQTLAIRSSTAKEGLEGEEARDPAFGLPALWIDDGKRDSARGLGYTLVDPITVLMTHLGEVVRAEAALLLTRSDVTSMLEGVRTRQVGLIEELIPGIMSISDIQRILQNLLAEEVSIRNIDFICEALVDVGRLTKDHSELTELVRQKLAHMICNDLRGQNEQLSVLSLDPRVEGQITDAIARSEGNAPMVIEPRLAESLMRKIIPLVDSMMQQGLAPVLLCGPMIRKQLRAFLRRSAPRLAVISVSEVPQSIDLRSYDILKVD
jgi:flagellar biosynthesis protein FlhA